MKARWTSHGNILSKQPIVFSDIMHHFFRGPEEKHIEQESRTRRRTRRQVKLETESKMIKTVPSLLVPDNDAGNIDMGVDMTTEYFEEEPPASPGGSATSE